MMKIHQFLADLSERDIKLWVDGDELRCNAPKGMLTATLIKQLQERKAEILSFLRRAEQDSDRPPIQPRPKELAGEIPLSFAQQRLWFLDQLEGPNATYNIPMAYHLSGPLNVRALEKSLSEIGRRHEALRTTFPTKDGSPVQQIASSTLLRVPVVELQAVRAEEVEIERLVTREAQQPFDLERGPLWRVTLLQLATHSHVLLLTMHHIISDGWSMALFVRELSSLYEAFSHRDASLCEGKPSPLPELAIQYADFSVWQRQWLQGEVLRKQQSYWQQQLAGAPPLLTLPTDYPRPPVQSFRGSSLSFSLPKQLSLQLQAFSVKSDATLFMTLLAGFKTLLYRYSAQEDILVGSPIANRHLKEIQPLIGFFVNTLVLRTDLSGDSTFLELLGRVRQVALEAYKYQDLPFERLLKAVKIERNQSYNPLFTVMFVLQNTPPEQMILEGLSVTPLPVENNTAKFDLLLEMQESEAGLISRWEYNRDLFEPGTIKRMSHHFQTLLEAIVINPFQPIGKLPLLLDSEQHQLLIEWNDTQANYPHAAGKCIHQLFEQQVERTPDAIAVVFGDEQLSYRELNHRANQLAHYLIGLGMGGPLGGEVLVGICIDRSIEMVVGLYAILKAGGAYVPLDPTHPPERLAFMLADAEFPLILTQANLKERLKSLSDQRLLCLDSEWALVTQMPQTNPMTEVQAKNLAYVIYTSGSTGTPKGAMNTHQAILNRLLWMQETYQLTPTDSILQKTPFSFDVSVWEFFWPLMFGASLVVARPEGHKDLAYFVDIITREQITTLHFVPSMLQLFVEAEGLHGCTSLKRVICSGEALPFDLMQRFFAKITNVELHNLYGPTEAAIDVTYWECEPESQLRIVPIGRPVANTQIYILDRYLQPVPIGVPGELHIGGVQVARGYLNRPELTREKFIPNPFAQGQLYKTGDSCRYLPDGNIEFLGRLDYQVKIRGFRIELGEIEAVLARHADIRESIVMVHEYEDRSGEKYLVAYLVPHQTAELSTYQLRDYLADKLPDYMIPATFVVLEEFPLNANGKIDRKALPAPSVASKLASGIIYVPPQSEIETILVNIWQKTLKTTPIGILDNYFALGGDSIRVIQLINDAAKYGLSMSAVNVFQHQTIRGLAQHITEFDTAAPPPLPLVELPVAWRDKLPAQVADAYPAAAMSTFMLHHYAHDEPRSAVYHLQLGYYLQDDKLSLEAFKQALRILIKRHPIMRTTFISLSQPQNMPQDDAKWSLLQLVWSDLPFEINEEDIRHLTYPEQERFIENLMQKDRKNPFDSTNVEAPLFRLWLLCRSANSFEFVMSIHHAISDGWGNVIFFKELFATYARLKQGHKVDETPMPLIHKELVAIEKEMMASTEATTFWQQQLASHQEYLLEPRSSLEELKPLVVVYSQMIDNDLIIKLQTMVQTEGVSLRALFVSAFLVLLAEPRDAASITVGLVANGRSERLSDPLNSLGLFWYFVPFCHSVQADKIKQIKSVQNQLLEIDFYAHYPLNQILADQQKTDLFYATLNFVHFHHTDHVGAQDLQIQQERYYDKFHFPLNYTIIVNPLSGEIELSVTYNQLYFSPDSVALMLDKYLANLRG